MSRKKNILLASACIVLGMALAGPAAHAAEEVLTAIRSSVSSWAWPWPDPRRTRRRKS